MPDANLFRESHSGLLFWSGIFEREPVILFQMQSTGEPHYRLFKVMPAGTLIECCEFVNGSGLCRQSARKMALNIKPGNLTAYISTVEKKTAKNYQYGAGVWSMPVEDDEPPASHRSAEWFKKYYGSSEGVAFAAAAVDAAKRQAKTTASKPSVPKPRVLDPMLDCFEYLGISTSATEEEINTAFRVELKNKHPDLSKASDADAKTKGLIKAREEALRIVRIKK